MTSPDDMLEFLKPRVNGATTPDEVATLMAPLASDSAWVHLGGSGARQQVFLLEGDLRTLFEFGGDDRLRGYTAYQSTEPWKKDQNGLLISAGPGSGVALVLVSEKG